MIAMGFEYDEVVRVEETKRSACVLGRDVARVFGIQSRM